MNTPEERAFNSQSQDTDSRRKKYRTVRLVGGIFLTIGLVIAAIGGYCSWRTLDLLTNGLRANARVVELRKLPTERYYKPVVQFVAADGRTITAAGKTATNPPAHAVSDSVIVVYRANDPQDICFDEPFELWFLTGIFWGIGTIFILVGSGMLLGVVRK